MAKKIMILCSSPREKGKTNTLVEWVIEGAEEAGAEVVSVDVAHMDYKTNGCISCYSCQKSEEYGCVIDDDASNILKRIHKYDVLIYATPVYFFGPNAQLKLILDRMFSLVKIDPETGEFRFQSTGQQLALIATSGGGKEDGIGRTDDLFKMVAGFQGSEYSSLLVPNSPNDPEELQADTYWQEKAAEFGRGLGG